MRFKFNYLVFIVAILILNSQMIFALEKNSIEPFKITSFDEVYSLDSYWMFVPEDNMNYRNWNIEQAKWYPLRPSAPWQSQLPEASNYYGNSWYGITFTIDKIDQNKKIGFLLPFGYGAVQIYVNGIFIDESSSFDNNDKSSMFGSKPSLVEIPIEVLNKNTNNLNIRVSSFSSIGGFPGFFYIGSFAKLQTKWIRSIIKDIGISLISLFLFIYFLVHYFFRKKEKYNLLLSCFSLFVGLFIIGYSGLSLYIFDYSWAYWVVTFIGGINMYLFPILFIHSFFDLKLGKTAKIFTGFYVLLNLHVFIEFMFTGQVFYFVKYIYYLFNFSYILLVVYLFLISIKAVQKKLAYSKTMLLSIILLGISFMYSMLSFTAVINKLPLVGEGFFLMMIVYSIILAKRFSQTHEDLELSHVQIIDMNRNLETKVEERTIELQQKNSQIMESLDYSAIILNNTFPKKQELQTVLSDHFVYWYPRDVVGGDFYWFYKMGDNFLFALADCTGHGVPGALLAMTAASVLQRIVNHINSDNPSIILNEMNRIMKRTLKQGYLVDLSDDGLDIGLGYFNRNEKILTYSASRIRLHIMENGELREIKGDRQGIGYRRSRDEYIYSKYEIPFSSDSKFYMTTDGFLDQSGGDKGFSLGWTRYKELIQKNSQLPMLEQKSKMVHFLEEFRGDYEQRDDISFVGFQINLE